MNLGAPPNDDEMKELKEKVSNLEGELEVEKDHCNDLESNLEKKSEEISQLKTALEEQQLEIESVKNTVHQKDAEILDIQGSLQHKNAQIERLEEELEGTHANISNERNLLEDAVEMKKKFENESEFLKDQIGKLKSQLDLEQNSAAALQIRHNREMEDVRNDLVTARKALEEETEVAKNHEKYVNLKLGEIASLMDKIDSLEKLVDQKNEEINKLQTGLDAVAQVTDEQSDAHVETMRELKKKNAMFDRLVEEYEIVKAKVRKYRNERNSSSSSVTSNFTCVGPEDKFYLRQGANKALAKANSIYNQRLKKFDADYASVMSAMQIRLEQLAICIEQILKNGSLEELSDSMRDILEQSLNESRRFSMAANENMPDIRPELPHVEVTLDDLELELGPQEDLGAIIESLKTNQEAELEEINQQIVAKEQQISKLSEKLSFIEDEKVDLRIKLGNAKEKVKQLEEEVAKLSDRSRFNKLAQEVQNLKVQLQAEISAKEDANGRLNYKDDELDKLRAELDEANEKLRKYQQRKEQVDKVLRHQLAKTHQVLKSTKTSMDNIANKQ